MKKICLSVVIPVYNSENYLEKCLYSVVNQTLADLEIIIVNDGSTDRSSDILKIYSEKYNNIKVVTTKNFGLSHARKTGIENAAGQYICFIDSDDYVDHEFLEKMYVAISENDADLAECAYYSFKQNKTICCELYSESYGIETASEFADKIIKNTIIDGNVAVVVWNKIYKREMIFETVTNYGKSPLEDYMFNMQYYCKVNKYVYMNEPLYYYRVVSNSLSRRYNPNVIDVLIDVQRKKEIVMKQLNLSNDECINLSYSWFTKYCRQIILSIFMYKHNLNFKEKIEHVHNVIASDKVQQICEMAKDKSLCANLFYNKRINMIAIYGLVIGMVYKIKVRCLDHWRTV